MVRESKMKAVLTENGFIDNATDVAKLKQDAFLDKVAQGHVNGMVKALKLEKKRNFSASGTHRIVVDGTQVGAYENDQNVMDAVERHLTSSNQILVEKL